jgi:DNA-binding NarL/FixJ family response regulator
MAAAIRTTNSQSMQVFLVDDSAIVRFRFLEMLAELDDVQVVGHAATVAEATLALSTLRPDVVIVDIRLPDGNGISILRTVKQVQPAPIVGVVTNFPSDQLRERCLAAGADFFLDKARQFDQLGTVLQRLQRDHSR